MLCILLSYVSVHFPFRFLISLHPCVRFCLKLLVIDLCSELIIRIHSLPESFWCHRSLKPMSNPRKEPLHLSTTRIAFSIAVKARHPLGVYDGT